jgi:hypothetical protein
MATVCRNALVRPVFAAALVCALAGCAHLNEKLTNNSVTQATMVNEMQQQQVLQNLAMFVCDYNAMPFFSFPNQSGAQVIDQDNGSASMGWSRANNLFGTQSVPAAASPLTVPLLLTAIGLSGGAQRSQQASFTVTPINDPRKLELMRCAYQLAITRCGRGAVSGTCPDCQTRFNVFYTGDPHGDIRQVANGIVTSECLKTDCCWFHAGCKKCWAKHGSCGCYGEYHGMFVWVGPEGRDELTKLTLAILDYALHDPPQIRSKQVVYYIDEYGLPTSRSLAVGQITASLAIDEQPESLLAMLPAKATTLEQFLDYRHKGVKDKLGASKLNPDERAALLKEDAMLQAKIDFLHNQLRAGGLKEPYYPGTTTPGAPNFLQFNLQQNYLPSFTAPPAQ